MSDDQSLNALIQRIVDRLGNGPTRFYDLLLELGDVEYRDILRAWGSIRERIALERDEHGRYVLPSAQETVGAQEEQPRLVMDRM